MIRIILVDDHTVVREALRLMLEQDESMQIVAEASDGEAALRMTEAFAPEVVVMDVGLTGLSGIETTRRLHARHPDVKVLVLSSHIDRGSIVQMLSAGASGYITKSAAGAELKRGINRVAKGERYLSSEVAELMSDSRQGSGSASGFPDERPLSPRELQITTLLAEGKSAPAIAAQLHISPYTVDVHRRNLMRKLDLHNVVDLTKYAIRAGLISP